MRPSGRTIATKRAGGRDATKWAAVHKLVASKASYISMRPKVLSSCALAVINATKRATDGALYHLQWPAYPRDKCDQTGVFCEATCTKSQVVLWLVTL